MASYLRAGEWLDPGQQMSAAAGRVVIELGKDGVLRLNHDGTTVWSKGKAPGGRLIMQADGNLVLYTSTGGVVWPSGTTTAGSYMVVQDDGNLCVQHDSPSWDSNTVAVGAPIGPANEMFKDTQLLAGDSRSTPDKRYRLEMRGEGDAVLWHGTTRVWSEPKGHLG